MPEQLDQRACRPGQLVVQRVQDVDGGVPQVDLSIQVFKYSSIQVFKYSSIQVFKYYLPQQGPSDWDP